MLVLRATTSRGDPLPEVRITDLRLVVVRAAYAQLVRDLDTADPLPALPPPSSRETLEVDLTP